MRQGCVVVPRLSRGAVSHTVETGPGQQFHLTAVDARMHAVDLVQPIASRQCVIPTAHKSTSLTFAAASERHHLAK
jgi:hypothetical protein